MTMTCIYKSIYAGGIKAYQQALENKIDVVISLVSVPNLVAATHHKIAPLHMDLPKGYQKTAQEIVALLDLSIKHNWKVLVHCMQGKVRSVGVALAYAHLRDPENAPKQTLFSTQFYQKFLTIYSKSAS